MAKVSTTYNVNYRVKDIEIDPRKRYDKPLPVELTTAYVNDQGGRYNEETKTFSQSEGGGTYTIDFSAKQAGMFLDKTFWVVFEWTDYGGKHRLESAKAVCTVPK